MQTLIEIEESQLSKLLFYTHAQNGTEAIAAVIQDYLSQKESANNQGEQTHSVDAQKKQLLKKIQNRFAVIPTEISLADELIEERHLEGLKEIQ